MSQSLSAILSELASWRSPTTYSTSRPSRFLRLEEARIRQRTGIFWARSLRTTWLPINPVPPVTKALIKTILDYFGECRCRRGFAARAVLPMQTLEHAKSQQREVVAVVGVFQIKHFGKSSPGEFCLVPSSIRTLCA